MSQENAISYLGNGHALWSVEQAREVCAAFNLKLPDNLIIRWKNQKDANPTNNPKGIWLNEPDKPGEGVGGIELSNYVRRQFKLKVPDYYGRGSQANANANALKKWFALN